MAPMPTPPNHPTLPLFPTDPSAVPDAKPVSSGATSDDGDALERSDAKPEVAHGDVNVAESVPADTSDAPAAVVLQREG